ncbi:MAG: hypothetical protein HQL53_06575 [Magnetococcales bacterium]|nr:hypothetical protein [Magnetococcales bacterium]
MLYNVELINGEQVQSFRVNLNNDELEALYNRVEGISTNPGVSIQIQPAE